MADTREATLKLRDHLLEQIKSPTCRTLGEALEEYPGALAARDVGSRGDERIKSPSTS